MPAPLFGAAAAGAAAIAGAVGRSLIGRWVKAACDWIVKKILSKLQSDPKAREKLFEYVRGLGRINSKVSDKLPATAAQLNKSTLSKIFDPREWDWKSIIDAMKWIGAYEGINWLVEFCQERLGEETRAELGKKDFNQEKLIKMLSDEGIPDEDIRTIMSNLNVPPPTKTLNQYTAGLSQDNGFESDLRTYTELANHSTNIDLGSTYDSSLDNMSYKDVKALNGALTGVANALGVSRQRAASYLVDLKVCLNNLSHIRSLGNRHDI